jgi:hypothetical protein
VIVKKKNNPKINQPNKQANTLGFAWAALSLLSAPGVSG